jgi:drug/metabolite transporter (DMT)-like permease
MIPVLAGLTAAVMWGLSTVVASRSTKAIGSQGALAWVMLIGGVFALALAPLFAFPHGASTDAWIWAVAAGAGSAFGLSMMYRALRIGKVGVVAPIASTEGALAAVLSIALGERLTAGVAVCLAVIALGIFVVTLRGSATDIHLRPSLYAMAAACSFGVGLVGSSKAGTELGALWTILVARAIGVTAVAVPLIVTRRLPRPRPARVWWMVTFSAAAELIGFAAFIGGSQHGVAIPAVLASQFAAVAAAVSYVLFGERLGVRQRAGAVVIFAGVAVLSLLRA